MTRGHAVAAVLAAAALAAPAIGSDTPWAPRFQLDFARSRR